LPSRLMSLGGSLRSSGDELSPIRWADAFVEHQDS